MVLDPVILRSLVDSYCYTITSTKCKNNNLTSSHRLYCSHCVVADLQSVYHHKKVLPLPRWNLPCRHPVISPITLHTVLLICVELFQSGPNYDWRQFELSDLNIEQSPCSLPHSRISGVGDSLQTVRVIVQEIECMICNVTLQPLCKFVIAKLFSIVFNLRVSAFICRWQGVMRWLHCSILFVVITKKGKLIWC